MIRQFWDALGWLKANLVWPIPVVMLLGLAFGALVDASFLKPLMLCPPAA